MSLREEKKCLTREHLADTARRLFAEQGFEHVTVAEVARAAGVAEKTVYNYFPRKEDLVYRRLEAFEEELLEAIRSREPGESALAAFGRFVTQRRGALSDASDADELRALTRMIAESPALIAREQQIFERYTLSLAELLAEETGARPGDVEPWVAANALMGVHRTLIDHVRSRLVEGAPKATIARELREQGGRAVALLESGMGGYAVRPRAGRD